MSSIKPDNGSKEILALLEQIPQEREALKAALTDWVDNFRFDLIISLSQIASMKNLKFRVQD